MRAARRSTFRSGTGVCTRISRNSNRGSARRPTTRARRYCRVLRARRDSDVLRRATHAGERGYRGDSVAHPRLKTAGRPTTPCRCGIAELTWRGHRRRRRCSQANRREAITLFVNAVGLGIQLATVGNAVFERAAEAGLGEIEPSTGIPRVPPRGTDTHRMPGVTRDITPSPTVPRGDVSRRSGHPQSRMSCWNQLSGTSTPRPLSVARSWTRFATLANWIPADRLW